MGVGVALFSGTPAKARESLVHFITCDVKGRHEVDTTVACTEAYPHSSEFVIVPGTYKTIGCTTHVYCCCDDTTILRKMTHVLLQ